MLEALMDGRNRLSRAAQTASSHLALWTIAGLVAAYMGPAKNLISPEICQVKRSAEPKS
jgi:hypothetical protein